MKLTTRLATNEDFVSCKKFDDRITETYFINMIENDQVFIALVDDIIVGYLRLEFIWLKIPYLSWLFVTPRVRK
tara:strand:- start:224 stop:445 length:222 start_codon:yes stop_codon:yes gene_type:complete